MQGEKNENKISLHHEGFMCRAIFRKQGEADIFGVGKLGPDGQALQAVG